MKMKYCDTFSILYYRLKTFPSFKILHSCLQGSYQYENFFRSVKLACKNYTRNIQTAKLSVIVTKLIHEHIFCTRHNFEGE